MKKRIFTSGDIDICVRLVRDTMGKRDSLKAKSGFVRGLNVRANKNFRYHNRWVILNNDKIIGIYGLYSRSSWPKGYVAIGWFVVSPLMQGKGYGTKSLVQMMNLARKHKFSHLVVWADKEAVSFYKNHGFVSSKISLMPREGDLLMVKKLF